MPKLSIVVPMYNVENYIDKCIKSLLNQTLKDIEIIIVNDGSQDNSKKIINKYLNNSKIIYFEKENGGLSSARNFGLKYANGEYIAFLDSDDYVEENMYEEMYKLAKKDEADMVECDFIWEWGNGKKRYDKRRKYRNSKEMMKRPRVVAWNRIIKKKIMEENNLAFPNGLIYEDLEFFYKIIPFVKKISYINKYFVHYRQREDSISNTQTEKTADIFKILDNIIEFYKENNLYDKYEKELKFMVKRILLGSSLKRILKIKDINLKRKMLLKTIVHLYKNLKRNNIKFWPEKNEKIKICFGITSLNIGGAERVLVDITNKLIDKYDITIFLIYKGGRLEKELNKKITIVSLFDKKKKSKVIPIFVLFCGKHIYNKYIKSKYDVDIAFLEGPVTRIFSYKGNKKKIAWVHNDIDKVFGNTIKAKLKKGIDKYFYKKYDQIIFVSKQNKKSFETIYGNISKRKVIYNYIDKDRILKMSKLFFPKEHGTFITVSRLVKQKGIDRFIKVHKRLIEEGFYNTVYVIGDGEEKENLQKLSKKLNVQDTFIFLGEKQNPYPYIKLAQYFALLSYFEGYGMVLEEAKILKKPIIITRTAAEEAAKNYNKKLIIENNEEEIFNELKKVLAGNYKYLKNTEQPLVYDNSYLVDEIKQIL